MSTALLAIAVLTGGGCAGKAVEEGDAAALYKDAEDDIESDHFQLAVDKLRAVKNKFPYSKYAIDAQLKIADVLYMQESYAEAASAYEIFRDLHPKHEKAPYAMFRIALSHFNDVPSTVARDLTPAYRALDAFNDFLRRFPTAPEAEEARKHVTDSRKLLADKELYIGDFYLKREQYESARSRFAKVIALFPDTETAKDAQLRLHSLEGKPKK